MFNLGHKLHGVAVLHPLNDRQQVISRHTVFLAIDDDDFDVRAHGGGDWDLTFATIQKMAEKVDTRHGERFGISLQRVECNQRTLACYGEPLWTRDT